MWQRCLRQSSRSWLFLTAAPDTANSNIALGIGLVAMAFLPVLHLSKRYRRSAFPSFGSWQFRRCSLSDIMAGGIVLSLYEQSTLASSSSYFLGLFTIAAFITIPPVVSAVLFLTGNVVFMALLPEFQTLPDVITTLNINTLSMTAVAWFLNQMASRQKIKVLYE